MEAAGLLPGQNPVIAKRIDGLASRLRRRQLVGSHNVAIETVNLLRDVVSASNIASFESLLDAVTQVGNRLQDAGRKEPVITNVLLRILKFLREEYQTALTSALSSATSATFAAHALNSDHSHRQSHHHHHTQDGSSGHHRRSSSSSPTAIFTPETPLSALETPFAAFPMDTSANFGHHPALKRQNTHFPFDTPSSSSGTSTSFTAGSAAPRPRRGSAGGPGDEDPLSKSTDSLDDDKTARQALQNQPHKHNHAADRALNSSVGAAGVGVQPIGTGSILELLGHKPEFRSLQQSASASASGTQTPLLNTTGTGGSHLHQAATPFDSPAPAASAHASSSSNAISSQSTKNANSQQHGANAILPSLQTTSSSSSIVTLAHAYAGSGQQNIPSTLLTRFADDFSRKAASLRPVFVDAVTELLEELAITRDQISGQAMEHIHSAEIILTLGHSSTVESFLKAASRKRRITVVVAETAPSMLGRNLALSLSKSGIQTLLIPDSGIYSLMTTRISKIIMGCHQVRADGSLVAVSGSLNVCKVAKELKIPVVVLSGMFKVSPEFGSISSSNIYQEGLQTKARSRGHHLTSSSSFSTGTDDPAATVAAGGGGGERNEEDDWDYGNPGEVLCLTGADAGGAGNSKSHDAEDVALSQAELQAARVDVEVIAPYYDRVPQDLVSLFITNIGAHPSSMIFRLLKELYE